MDVSDDDIHERIAAFITGRHVCMPCLSRAVGEDEDAVIAVFERIGATVQIHVIGGGRCDVCHGISSAVYSV